MFQGKSLGQDLFLFFKFQCLVLGYALVDSGTISRSFVFTLLEMTGVLTRDFVDIKFDTFYRSFNSTMNDRSLII